MAAVHVNALLETRSARALRDSHATVHDPASPVVGRTINALELHHAALILGAVSDDARAGRRRVNNPVVVSVAVKSASGQIQFSSGAGAFDLSVCRPDVARAAGRVRAVVQRADLECRTCGNSFHVADRVGGPGCGYTSCAQNQSSGINIRSAGVSVGIANRNIT